MRKLFLDDERQPWDDSWDHVKTPLEFKKYITYLYALTNKLPDIISFDHDLHYEHFDIPKNYSRMYENYKHETGWHCAKWLCDFCIDEGLEVPEISIHSANKIGADNIAKTIMNVCLFYYEDERIIVPKPYDLGF